MRKLFYLIFLLPFISSAQVVDTSNGCALQVVDDGNHIETIDGYKVHVGTEPGEYTQEYDVKKKITNTCEELGLVKGEYYLSATAYRGEQQSAFSDELRVVLFDASVPPSKVRIIIGISQ